MGDTVAFFPTEELKIRSEKQPITSYIPDDGRDPDPAWDVVARSLWPATRENMSHRESLASTLMYAVYDETIQLASRDTSVITSRMVQTLMGRAWMDRWLRDNYFDVSKRVEHNRRVHGGAATRFLKRLFT